MLASILISAVCVLLFIYWFRYSCLLLLRSRVERSAGPSENQFSFLEVRQRLSTEPGLDPLHRSLERDYRILTYLLRHTAMLGPQSLEDRILILDYKLMRVWYRLTRIAAPEQASEALSEMAAVLACLAQKMDEKTGLHISS
jgi:hypothetical protein